jgi:hypothetical protein
MTSANDKQVGGTHYKSFKLQHWDFVVRAGLGYLDGQVSKYVDRHRRKHGAQDVEKAIHFAEKLFEEATAGRIVPVRAFAASAICEEFLSDRTFLLSAEKAALRGLCIWTRPIQIIEIIDLLKTAHAEAYPPLTT